MIHSAALAFGHVTVTGDVVLYTAPSNGRTIVKWWSVVNVSGAVSRLLLAIKPSGGSQQYFTVADNVPNDGLVGGAVWFVLNPGDQLIGNSDHVGSHHVIAGAELTS